MVATGGGDLVWAVLSAVQRKGSVGEASRDVQPSSQVSIDRSNSYHTEWSQDADRRSVRRTHGKVPPFCFFPWE